MMTLRLVLLFLVISLPVTGLLGTPPTTGPATTQVAEPRRLLLELVSDTKEKLPENLKLTAWQGGSPTKATLEDGSYVIPLTGKAVRFTARVVLNSKQHTFARDVTADDVKSGRIRWTLPLSRVNRGVEVLVIDKETKLPVQSACVVLEGKVTPGNAAQLIELTNADGVARFTNLWEDEYQVVCRSVVLPGSRVHLYLQGAQQVELKGDTIQTGKFTLATRVPTVSAIISVMEDQGGKLNPIDDDIGTLDVTARDGNGPAVKTVLAAGKAHVIDAPAGSYSLSFVPHVRNDKFFWRVQPTAFVVAKDSPTELEVRVSRQPIEP